MTKREARATELFQMGYNCAQAVFAAFADCANLDERAALRLAAPFGGGYGRLREVCGAASGMAMALGGMEGYDDVAGRDAHYARVQALMDAFRREFGSYICRDLLADHAAGIGEKPCTKCVAYAARLLEAQVKA
jgi:C_GCAxxG_C_C family probable redox protein